jgi:hypothetical protein
MFAACSPRKKLELAKDPFTASESRSLVNRFFLVQSLEGFEA